MNSLFIYRITNEISGKTLLSSNPDIAERFSRNGYTVKAKKENRVFKGGI